VAAFGSVHHLRADTLILGLKLRRKPSRSPHPAVTKILSAAGDLGFFLITLSTPRSRTVRTIITRSTAKPSSLSWASAGPSRWLMSPLPGGAGLSASPSLIAWRRLCARGIRTQGRPEGPPAEAVLRILDFAFLSRPLRQANKEGPCNPPPSSRCAFSGSETRISACLSRAAALRT